MKSCSGRRIPPRLPTPLRRTTPRPPSKDLSAELQVLRAQLEDIKRVLQLNNARAQELRSRISTNCTASWPPLIWISSLVRQITDQVATLWQALPPAQRSAAGIELLRGLAEECIRTQLRIAPVNTSKEQEGNRILVFTGPPGAGKTTTLTKIAIQEFLARRVSVRIISVDPYRVASHEKLRSFAGILGTGFTAATTMREFIEAVEEFRGKNVLLIDTPGYSPAKRFRRRPGSERVPGEAQSQGKSTLVLPAPPDEERADLEPRGSPFRRV